MPEIARKFFKGRGKKGEVVAENLEKIDTLEESGAGGMGSTEGEVDTVPLLAPGNNSSNAIPDACSPQSSAFAAPAQQALGPFGELPMPPPRAASFSSGNLPPMHQQQQQQQQQQQPQMQPQPLPPGLPVRTMVYPDRPPARAMSFTNGVTSMIPNQDALVYRYPSCSMMMHPAGNHVPWTAPSLMSFSAPQQPQHPQPYILSPNVSIGGKYAQNTKWGSKGRCPSLVSLINMFSCLVLLMSAPLGIWYSYFLWVSSTILFAGPLAAGLALGAVFFTKWGCCSTLESKMRIFKLLVTMAGLADFFGAIIIPLVMMGVICPDDEIESCEYDKPHGAGFSMATSVVMGVHGLICIVARFRCKHMISRFMDNENSSFDATRNSGLQQSLLQSGEYSGRAQYMPNMNLSFTSPNNYYPGYGLPISRPV